VQHHSGSADYPVRDKDDFLTHLDEASDPLTVQKLQVEATIHLARAVEFVGQSIAHLCDVDSGIQGHLDLSLQNAYGGKKLAVVVSEGESDT
jgi:hypothetical protein